MCVSSMRLLRLTLELGDCMVLGTQTSTPPLLLWTAAEVAGHAKGASDMSSPVPPSLTAHLSYAPDPREGRTMT